jgi:hypothetical protein
MRGTELASVAVERVVIFVQVLQSIKGCQAELALLRDRSARILDTQATRPSPNPSPHLQVLHV